MSAVCEVVRIEVGSMFAADMALTSRVMRGNGEAWRGHAVVRKRLVNMGSGLAHTSHSTLSDHSMMSSA
jgi:hypothetical protein